MKKIPISDLQQLDMVKQKGWAIRYIKNPSKEVQLAAIKQKNGQFYLSITFLKKYNLPL